MAQDYKDTALFDNFKVWVDQQPKRKRYDYSNAFDCAFTQYLKSLGYDEAIVSPNTFSRNAGTGWCKLPVFIQDAVFGTPRTFGALSKRLEK